MMISLRRAIVFVALCFVLVYTAPVPNEGGETTTDIKATTTNASDSDVPAPGDGADDDEDDAQQDEDEDSDSQESDSDEDAQNDDSDESDADSDEADEVPQVVTTPAEEDSVEETTSQNANVQNKREEYVPASNAFIKEYRVLIRK